MKPLLKSRSLHNSNDRSKYSDFVKVTRASVYSRAPNKNSDDSIHDHSKKETVAERANRRRAWLKAVHRQNVFSAAIKFLKELPYLVWKRYIVALLIPRYRPEWGRYNKWEPLSRKERKIKEKKKSPHKSLAAASVRNSKSKKRSISKKKQKHATDLPPKPVKHDHTNCIPVRINISGQIFEPQLRTLKQFPDTLLGNPKKMIQYYDPSRDEFFFDRHRSSFEAILYYYNTGGILRRPSNVDSELFLEEVKFFELGNDLILGLQNIDASAEEDRPLPRNLLKRKIWLLFEYPESSYQSRILAFISVLAVCISIFEFCIETLPEFKLVPMNLRQTVGHHPQDEGDSELSFADPFFFAETLCIMFFVFEYLIRALTCPNFFTFSKEISNVIDLVAILPYFLNLIYSLDEQQVENGGPVKENKAVSLTVLRIIRLVRVFRILKLSRHNRGLKVLGKTLKSSFRELGLLMFFLMVGVMVFSSVIFFAEAQYENTPFKSVPTGFWFGVVTMTTLGYGDLVPVGPWGKIIGALCAITGVLTISLPVPVIVSNFNMFYNSEEIHKSSTPDTRKRPECNYIEQCPYYPAMYSHDGEVIGDTMKSQGKKEKANEESNSAQWLRGEQKQDQSDSDFDELLKVEPVKKRVLPKPKVRPSTVSKTNKKSTRSVPIKKPQIKNPQRAKKGRP